MVKDQIKRVLNDKPDTIDTLKVCAYNYSVFSVKLCSRHKDCILVWGYVNWDLY